MFADSEIVEQTVAFGLVTAEARRAPAAAPGPVGPGPRSGLGSATCVGAVGEMLPAVHIGTFGSLCEALKKEAFQLSANFRTDPSLGHF